MVKKQQITFGAGCFWCVEPIFNELKGVLDVYPGYAGGHIKNPSYKEVCQGTTGHVEVVRVEFDENRVDFKQLLEVFWFTHDPTTINRQGNDSGEQYKSVIFYHTENQMELAQKYKEKLNQSGIYNDPIVTEIEALTTFYKAEDDHRNFYINNPEVSYCTYVVRPKVEKFRAAFKDQLKSAH